MLQGRRRALASSLSIALLQAADDSPGHFAYKKCEPDRASFHLRHSRRFINSSFLGAMTGHLHTKASGRLLLGNILLMQL